MAPRKTKAKEESPLLTALRFVELAQEETGPANQTHCRIYNGTVTAFNGIIAAGIPLADELPHLCPKTFQLVAALDKARGPVAITQADNSHMLFKSEKMKALVECIEPTSMQFVGPDEPAYPLNDNFRRAGSIAATLTKEGATRVILASILTKNGSLVGTNGNAVIEAHHGVATPPGLIMPKVFFDHLNKINKPIARFGFSDQSFTIWFEDRSWIKTQLYIDTWPDIEAIFATQPSPQDLPKDFVEAIQAVCAFSEDSRIYFGNGQVRSHYDENKGAQHFCKGLVEGFSFNYKHLLQLSPHMQKIDFQSDERAALFVGADGPVHIRGAISKMRPQVVDTAVNPYSGGAHGTGATNADLDADIPF